MFRSTGARPWTGHCAAGQVGEPFGVLGAGFGGPGDELLFRCAGVAEGVPVEGEFADGGVGDALAAEVRLCDAVFGLLDPELLVGHGQFAHESRRSWISGLVPASILRTSTHVRATSSHSE